MGRLTSYSAGTASGMYSYDAMGRTVSDWQVPPSKNGTGNFLQSRTYDKAGNVKTFSDAVNTTFYLTYDSGGNLTQVTTPFADSTHPGTLFTANTSDYGRFGLGAYVAGGSINSGVKTVLSYTNFGELTSKSATDTGGTGTTRFSMGTMSYAPNGMLTGATVNSSAWSHAYDDMGRILTSQNGSTVTYGYQYDRYGNRWHQNVTAGTGNQVDMPTDNTTNKISTTGITQDALGNITNDGSHTYTFDAENRITQVDSGSTATYVYDAFNRRVKKTVGSLTREFLFDAANRPFVEVGNSGTSWVRTEIFIGGTHLATYSNGHTYFHHQNWLGSRATTTDETGAKVQDCEWYPFGDLKGCTTNSNLYAYTPYGYADYERDSETGLDHMQFRYYNSRMGRFMGADLLDGDVSFPQTHNKFAYVLGDPVNANDPTGLWCSGDIPGRGGDTPCNPANSGNYGGGVGYAGGSSFMDGTGPNPFGWFGGGISRDGSGSGGIEGVCCDLPSSVSLKMPAFGGLLPKLPRANCMPICDLTPGYSLIDRLFWGGKPVNGLWHYGNWCGYDGQGIPIDDVDVACFTHDWCYAAAGISYDSHHNYVVTDQQRPAMRSCNQNLCNSVAVIADSPMPKRTDYDKSWNGTVEGYNRWNAAFNKWDARTTAADHILKYFSYFGGKKRCK